MQLFSTQNAIDAARTSVGETQWGGDGGAAWRAGLTTSHALAQELMDGFRAAANVISAYTAEVEEIKTEMAVQWQLEAEALELMRWSGEWYNPLDHLRELGEQQLGQSQMQQAAAAITALAIRRRDADDAFVRDMAAALPENWSEQRAAFAAVGLESVDDLDPQSIADAMFELSNRLTASDAMQYDDVEMLDTFYELYGNDPEIMSRYFGLLGGEGTVEVIDMLAHQAHGTPDAVDAALLLRQSLSMVSLGWDQPTAEGFADGLFTGEHYFPDGDVDNIAAIGFLFGDSDEAPMGPELALTTAVRVEELELATGNALQRFNTGMADFRGTNLLWREEGRELGEEMANPPGEVDISALVLETLGKHPEYALEFLSGNSPERINHWYGDRDWSMDGFEGAGELWYAAIRGTELRDGGDPAQAIAIINTEVMHGLEQNESLVSEDISAEGGRALGAAIGLNLDAIAAWTGGQYPSADVDSGGSPGDRPLYTNYFVLGSDETYPGPALSFEILQKLFGEVGATPSGAAALDVSFRMHKAAYFAAVESDPDLFDAAMNRTATIAGLLDGAEVRAALQAAEREEIAAEAEVAFYTDMVANGIGPIPIPGGHLVGVAAGHVVDLGADFVSGMINDARTDFADAQTSFVDAQAANEHQEQLRLAQRFWEHHDMGNGDEQVRPAPMAPQSPPGDATAAEQAAYAEEYAAYVADSNAWISEVEAHLAMPETGINPYQQQYGIAEQAGQAYQPSAPDPDDD